MKLNLNTSWFAQNLETAVINTWFHQSVCYFQAAKIVSRKVLYIYVKMYSKCIIKLNCSSHDIDYKTQNPGSFLKRLVAFPDISGKLKKNNSERLILRKESLFA